MSCRIDDLRCSWTDLFKIDEKKKSLRVVKPDEEGIDLVTAYFVADYRRYFVIHCPSGRMAVRLIRPNFRRNGKRSHATGFIVTHLPDKYNRTDRPQTLRGTAVAAQRPDRCFHRITELRQQGFRIQLHVLQHIRHGIPFVGQFNFYAAVRKTNTSTASVSPNRLCMLPRISGTHRP